MVILTSSDYHDCFPFHFVGKYHSPKFYQLLNLYDVCVCVCVWGGGGGGGGFFVDGVCRKMCAKCPDHQKNMFTDMSNIFVRVYLIWHPEFHYAL